MERTIETNYLTAVNWLNNSRILCNKIVNIDELFWENCRFDLDEVGDLFQFYLTNCSKSDVEYLEQHFSLLFSYSKLLDLYVLCVNHYGTHWSSVPCYTDIKKAKIKEEVSKKDMEEKMIEELSKEDIEEVSKKDMEFRKWLADRFLEKT